MKSPPPLSLSLSLFRERVGRNRRGTSMRIKGHLRRAIKAASVNRNRRQPRQSYDRAVGGDGNDESSRGKLCPECRAATLGFSPNSEWEGGRGEKGGGGGSTPRIADRHSLSWCVHAVNTATSHCCHLTEVFFFPFCTAWHRAVFIILLSRSWQRARQIFIRLLLPQRAENLAKLKPSYRVTAELVCRVWDSMIRIVVATTLQFLRIGFNDHSALSRIRTHFSIV